jgi:molybdopterin-binding protein
MLFKETEVSIGKALSGNLSLRNRLKSKIKTIEKGTVLTKITLDYKGKDIISVITTRSTNKLDLKVGDEVQGLVKANEVIIMK